MAKQSKLHVLKIAMEVLFLIRWGIMLMVNKHLLIKKIILVLYLSQEMLMDESILMITLK